MIGSNAALSMLACALGAPGVKVSIPASATPAGRWRGTLGIATELHVQNAPRRAMRLQVLRRVLDLEPGGRWALEVLPSDDSGLLGPYRSANVHVFDLENCLASWPHPVLLRRLFLWVDGTRVDAQLARRFPGAAPDLALDPAPRLPAFLAALAARYPPPVDAKAALRVALSLHRRLLAMKSGAIREPGVPDEYVEVRDQQPATDSPLLGGRRRFDGIGPIATRGDPKTAGSTDGASTPGKQQGSVDGRVVIDPADRRKATPTASAESIRVASLPSAPDAADRITQHDEWDFHTQSYRRRWTSVHERRIVGTDPTYLSELRERYRTLSQQVRRRFVRMSADAVVRERRAPDGEHIDLDAALDAYVARRARLQHVDDRLYEARPRRRRDVSVALLLDMSGSTSYPIPSRDAHTNSHADSDNGEPEDVLWQVARHRASSDDTRQRRVIDVTRDAAGLLCDALHALGDRHAVFAFSGEGRKNVDFAIVKDFDDDSSSRWGAALAAVEPRGSTRTGAAVRHALRHLRAQPTRRKLLIVLSDGYPQDSDYGPDRNDSEYGVKDTAHALREAEIEGISTFNISVDAGATDYLRRMCPRNRYWVVDDVDALPGQMLSLYRLMSVAS